MARSIVSQNHNQGSAYEHYLLRIGVTLKIWWHIHVHEQKHKAIQIKKTETIICDIVLFCVDPELNAIFNNCFNSCTKKYLLWEHTACFVFACLVVVCCCCLIWFGLCACACACACVCVCVCLCVGGGEGGGSRGIWFLVCYLYHATYPACVLIKLL